MADQITNKTMLSMEMGFADGDTRTLNVDNPNTAINLSAQVKNLGSYMRENQPVLGDKTDAAFTGMKSAKIVRAQTTKLDLSAV